MGYKGPSMQFKTVAGFERATDVCMKYLRRDEWWGEPDEGLLHFVNSKAEERFMSIWSNLPLSPLHGDGADNGVIKNV